MLLDNILILLLEVQSFAIKTNTDIENLSNMRIKHTILNNVYPIWFKILWEKNNTGTNNPYRIA